MVLPQLDYIFRMMLDAGWCADLRANLFSNYQPANDMFVYAAVLESMIASLVYLEASLRTLQVCFP